jgi:hypothetical protein
MTPGVMVADQKHCRVIDQRATHALAARPAESCDQQHIVSSLKSSTTTTSALTLRHNLVFPTAIPGILPSRHLPEREAMLVTLAVRLRDVLPRRTSSTFGSRAVCFIQRANRFPMAKGGNFAECGEASGK